MEANIINVGEVAAAFYTPITIRTLTTTAASTAEWDATFPNDPYLGRAVVLTKGTGGKLAGMYAYTDRGYELMIGYEDFCGLVAQGSSFDVVYNVSTDFAIPSGGEVWYGGAQLTLDPIPANRKVAYVVAVPGAETGGGGGGGGAVTSVNGQTGAVVLAAADVGAATAAQGALAATALQPASSLDATKLTGTVPVASIPNLDAGKITSGTLPVARGGTGTAGTITGYVKGNGASAMTAAATIPVADISGTLTVAQGGTGAATLTGYVKGNGTGAMTAAATVPLADVNATAATTGFLRATNGTAALSSSPLAAADIPNLDAGKITTGTLASARLPIAANGTLGAVATTVGGGLSINGSGILTVAAVAAGAGNIGGVTRQAAIADATGWTDNAAMLNFNTLLGALRNAGVLA